MTYGVPRWKRNVAQGGDALDLLTSLPDACAALAFFDPQHRGVLDKLAFGNEGARQRERRALPAMGEDYIDACCREIARVITGTVRPTSRPDVDNYVKAILDAINTIVVAADSQIVELHAAKKFGVSSKLVATVFAVDAAASNGKARP
jgi:Endodeoxyribonuclease RusA